MCLSSLSSPLEMKSLPILKSDFVELSPYLRFTIQRFYGKLLLSS
jgi:hypothetical protein